MSTRASVTAPTITAVPWGAVDGQPVELHTMTVAGAAGPATVRVTTYGGIVQSIEVPDRDGHVANVALGFGALDDYVSRSPYFGCITGRYANRIAGGRFSIEGTMHRLAANQPPNHLHGGVVGFDKKVWAASPAPSATTAGIVLGYTSPDGEEGYPGTLTVRVAYALAATGGGAELRVEYHATTDAPTVVNLTNHTYLNLAGEGSGPVTDHVLSVAAAHYTPVDATQIPTGAVEPVAGTPFDFTRPTPIGARISEQHPQLVIGQGYDHNLVLTGAQAGPAGTPTPAPAARLVEPGCGRALDILTTEPGVQLYTGNLLDGALVGPSGNAYGPHAGIALETQHFPDSPNQPGFPSTVLHPGSVYRSTTVYRFTTIPR